MEMPSAVAFCFPCRPQRQTPLFFLLGLLLSALSLRPGLGLYAVNTVYGDTIVLPCHLEVPNGLLFAKWKYEIANKASESIALRSAKKPSAQYDNVPEYKDRISLSENYTLSIYNARIGDEKKFVCMLVTEDDVFEQATLVKVFKQPSQPEIVNQAEFLETEELKLLGECITRDGYPAGNITWFKNGAILQQAEEAVVIDEQTDLDKASGLYTIKSSLKYKPTKDDTGAQFTCTVTYFGPNGPEIIRSEPAVLDIYYPTEKVQIEILSQKKTIKEGDNITLKCSGNGNPPPQEFLFFIPGEPGPIRSSSFHMLTDVRRNATGKYRCSLTDESLMDSTTVTVHYLDLSLTPSGEVIKQIGEALPVSCTISSSKNATVFWLKRRNKAERRRMWKKRRYNLQQSSFHAEETHLHLCEQACPPHKQLPLPPASPEPENSPCLNCRQNLQKAQPARADALPARLSKALQPRFFAPF